MGRLVCCWQQPHALTCLLLVPPSLDSIEVCSLQQLHSTLKVVHRQAQRLLLLLLLLLLLRGLLRVPLQNRHQAASAQSASAGGR
jgi:hypothetical protein